MIYGQGGAQLGYLLGCESQAIAQRFGDTMPRRVQAFRERGYDVILTHRGVRPPAYTDDWERQDLPVARTLRRDPLTLDPSRSVNAATGKAVVAVDRFAWPRA